MSTTQTPQDSKVAIQGYITSLWAEGRLSPQTVEAYRLDLVGLDRRLRRRGKHLLSVAPADVENDVRIAESRGRSVATINRYVTSARVFFNYLQSGGMEIANPVTIVRPHHYRQPDPSRLLTREQLKLVCTTTQPGDPRDERDTVLLRVLASTDIKSSGVAMLCVNEIDFVTGSGPMIRRGRRVTPSFFSPELRAEIKRYMGEWRPDIILKKGRPQLFPSYRQAPLSRAAIWHVLKRRLKRHRLPHITAGELRRSYVALRQ